MPTLLIHTADGDHRVSFEGERLLYDLIARLPDAPDRPCGMGICGRCAVAAQGCLSSSPDTAGKVLACQTYVNGDAEVWLPRRRALTQIETRTRPSAFPFDRLPGTFGAAVDLGTTTIVLQLMRMADGEILATVSCENPQRIVAADVIGRIGSAMEGRLGMLSSLVRDAIDSLEREAFSLAKLPGTTADVRVISGNTTMLYLYSDRDPRTLSAAPFEADCLFGLQEGRDLLPACAGAFVGADITCALLDSGMCGSNDTAMLIDIGTNGEIALRHNGQLYCCATAAGPAFEGGGISCGVGSIPGAIDGASVQDGEITFTTIGNLPATGICGSGLIALTAALLDTEQLDETGALDDDISLADGVMLTQQDIRQIQLAKGAIAAGIEVLLHRAGISCRDVQTLYIAGGFGSHLDLTAASCIGLIPAELAKKAVVLGNASLSGARQILLNQSAWQISAEIAAQAQCLNLAADPHFSDAFIENMMFE